VTSDTLAAANFGELLEPRRLNRLAEERRSEYVGNLPFPHIVLDNFLPPVVLATTIAEFPGPNAIAWKLHRHRYSDKLACGDDLLMGPMTRRLLRELNSGYFLQFLERLTGINGLISDPLLNGGGLHQILPGGHLGIHADFNFHPQWHLDRRLNLLIYLNENWEDGFGGHLELWNSDMSQCVDKILPIAGRCVIFNTSDTSFHGHPLPLSCPATLSRALLLSQWQAAIGGFAGTFHYLQGS
jgi:2OG-Fe(II) oxygenase superfamily